MTLESRKYGQLSLGSGQSALFIPDEQESMEQSQQQSSTLIGACSQDPQDWVFSSLELSVQPAYRHRNMGTMKSEK